MEIEVTRWKLVARHYDNFVELRPGYFYAATNDVCLEVIGTRFLFLRLFSKIFVKERGKRCSIR